MTLRISHSLHPVYNLGPGKRIAVWFQGCSIHCKGCLNKENWDFAGGREVEVWDLLATILSQAKYYDGITFSGGEPFDQYDALILLCSLIKATTGLDILVFSGYSLVQIMRRYPGQHYLDVIDYLVDGPFVRDDMANEGLKGSNNQQIYRVSPSGCTVLESLNVPRLWSLSMGKDHQARLSGIPRKGDLSKLQNLLDQKGISWS